VAADLDKSNDNAYCQLSRGRDEFS